MKKNIEINHREYVKGNVSKALMSIERDLSDLVSFIVNSRELGGTMSEELEAQLLGSLRDIQIKLYSIPHEAGDLRVSFEPIKKLN